MTPPDSGFHFQCADPDCPLCAANRAIKPDSGDRELTEQYPCPHGRASWHHCPHCLGLNQPIPYVAPTSDVQDSAVVISKSLAQRILAALEELPRRRSYDANELLALATELRERLPP